MIVGKQLSIPGKGNPLAGGAQELPLPTIAQPHAIPETIWADLLRITPKGRNDNFFELGFHSLLATRIANELENAFKAVVGQLRQGLDASLHNSPTHKSAFEGSVIQNPATNDLSIPGSPEPASGEKIVPTSFP